MIKKVTIRLGDLRGITGSLTKVLNQDLPVKQAYRMSKLAKAVQNELKDLETQRTALIKKFGERDEQGNLAVKTKVEEYMAEYEPLLNEEVELSVIPLDLTELEQLKVSPLDIANLEPFIDEKSEALLEDEENKGKEGKEI